VQAPGQLPSLTPLVKSGCGCNNIPLLLSLVASLSITCVLTERGSSVSIVFSKSFFRQFSAVDPCLSNFRASQTSLSYRTLNRGHDIILMRRKT